MTAKKIECREDVSTAAEYLRMALPLMTQRQIPLTPNNYALWYAHVQNLSPELSQALLETFPGPGCYDHEKSESLFFEFFIKNDLSNSPRVQNLLVNIVAQLAQAVSKSLKETQKYSATLKEAVELFDMAVDSERIRNALEGLLADTAAMENVNTEFQVEIQSAQIEVEQLRKELEESRRSARLDALTKIANRCAFDEALNQSLSMTDEPTWLLLLDLDYFKRCNDTYGHQMGDRILESVGAILAGVQSETVFVACYGGEEFTVIVNDQSAVARRLAEALRLRVSALRLKRTNSTELIGAITVSIGLAQARDGDTPQTLIERADVALYRAKNAGRNTVVVWGES